MSFDPSKEIQITWSTEDVLSIRKDLTEEEAFAVLQEAEHSHDANIGINWEVLRTHAHLLFPNDDYDEDNYADDDDESDDEDET